jgi:ABC-2 type transport system permease protein
MNRIRAIFSKQNRALLSELVRTDFKLRYQGSVLGYLWSLLRPLLLFMILYLVFVKFLKIGSDVPNYPVYLLFGIVVWNFFVETTMQSLGSIVGRGDLIRKIRIPRWMIVLSTSLNAVINLLLNILVIAVFMILGHVPLTISALWLPLLFIEIYLFAFGVSLLLAALFVKYRDISYIWEVMLQAGFYATPVLYPLSRIKNIPIKTIMLFNPLGQALQDARYCLVTKATEIPSQVFTKSWFEVVPFIVVIIFLVVGILYFKKESKFFAENI